jgi:hypothetical protein
MTAMYKHKGAFELDREFCTVEEALKCVAQERALNKPVWSCNWVALILGEEVVRLRAELEKFGGKS